MPIDGTAIAVEVGVVALKAVAPRGLGWIRTKVFGKKILVVGPKEAGKSTFVDFLKHGTLQPARHRLRDDKPSDSIALNIGISENKRLELSISSLVAFPGQYGADLQAKLVVSSKPDALVIIIDISKDEDKQWLDDYLKQLKHALGKGAKSADRLKCVALSLNKSDKLKASQIAGRVRGARKKMVSALEDALGPAAETAIVRANVLVSGTRHKDKHAHDFVVSLAAVLSE